MTDKQDTTEEKVATLEKAIGDLVVTGEHDFLESAIVIYVTNNIESSNDALGVMSINYIPRWIAKGMLKDALDLVTGVE